MAETISSVGAAKDYTDVTAWEAGEQTSVSSGNQVVAEWYGLISETAAIEIVGWTFADTTARIIWRPASGEEHDGTPGSGARLVSSETATHVIRAASGLTAVNATISGLEIYRSAGTGDIVSIGVTTGDTYDWVIEDCIFHGLAAATAAACRIQGAGEAATLVAMNNCVGYGNGTQGALVYTDAAEEHQIAASFCTMYELNYGAIRGVLTNCMAMKSNTNDYLLPGAGSNYNISSDTSAPGANNLQSKTTYASYFTDPTNKDFSLLGTTDDGGIFGVTGLAGTPIAGITTDILGGTRDETSPDLGAFEFGATPPGPGGGGGGPLGSKFSKFLN